MAKHPALEDPAEPPRRGRLWRTAARNLPGLSIVLMAMLLLGIVLWPYMVITVPSGQVGVLWHRFFGFDPYCWCLVDRGTVLNPRELREEGLHVIAPWNKLFIYDLRLQSRSETYHAISKDGVSVGAEVNIRYQLVHNSAGVLHKFVGPDYFDTILSPEIGAQTRDVISDYTAQQVYTSREKIQQQIRDNAQKILAEKLNKLVQPSAMEESDPQHYNDFLAGSILILDTLVLGIELPPEIVAAINRQTEQYYMIQEYKYRVQREAEESQRKMIEANGIAAFERTVSQGISDSYLRWQGINATLALAQSPNAKIVVIGSGKDGLPIILGNADIPTAGATAPTKPPTATVPGASENGSGSPSSSVVPGGQQPTGGTLSGGGSSPVRTGPPANSVPAESGPAKPQGSSTVRDIVGSALSRFYGRLSSPPPGPAPEKGIPPGPAPEKGMKSNP
jgi:regulator of protease activity HflC (stomatin/prohibitin superfamily)